MSDFATLWTAVCQASLSFIISRSLLKLMSIESMMPFNPLTLCRPLLLLLSIFSSIRVFFNESALRIRWPKYWSFSFSISPYNDSGLISFNPGLISLLSLKSLGVRINQDGPIRITPRTLPDPSKKGFLGIESSGLEAVCSHFATMWGDLT